MFQGVWSKIVCAIAQCYLKLAARFTGHFHAPNQVALIFRLWRQAYGDSLIDLTSKEFEFIKKVSTHYLIDIRPLRNNAVEGLIDAASLQRKYRDLSGSQSHEFAKFVGTHRASAIIQEHLQVSYLISIEAAKISDQFSPGAPNEVEQMWRKKLVPGRLPASLQDEQSFSRVKRWVKRTLRDQKYAIANSNRKLIDFSFLSIATGLAVLGPFLVGVGLVRTYILGSFFRLDFTLIYSISDYLAAGVNAVPQFAAGMALAGLLAILRYSGPDTHLTPISAKAKKLSASQIFVEVILFLAIPTFALIWFRDQKIDFASLMVGGAWIIARFSTFVSARAFSSPIKAYAILVVIGFTLFLSAVNAARDAERIASKNGEITLAEIDGLVGEWRIVSITDGFVVVFNPDTNKALAISKERLKGLS